MAKKLRSMDLGDLLDTAIDSSDPTKTAAESTAVAEMPSSTDAPTTKPKPPAAGVDEQTVDKQPQSSPTNAAKAPTSTDAPTPKPKPPAAETSITEADKEDECWLQMKIPRYLKDALDQRAVTDRTTRRVVVLRALKETGFPVNVSELVDRRK